MFKLSFIIILFNFILTVFALNPFANASYTNNIQASKSKTITYQPVLEESQSPQKESELLTNKKSNMAYVNHNNIYIEAFGRAGLYTLGYEYSATPRITMGLGYSYQSLNLNPSIASSNTQIQLLPIYAQFYFPYGSHRPFLSTGATFVSIKSENDFDINSIFKGFKMSYQDNESNRVFSAEAQAPDVQANINAFLAIPNIATGYEYKVSSNSFLRGTVLALLLKKPTAWAGLSVGVGF